MRQRTAKQRRPLPTAKDGSTGAVLSLTNARRHLRAANILGEQRLFGLASSLVVLALEEISKAWLLMCLGMGIDIPKGLLADVMTKHKARHAMTFGSAYSVLVNSLVARAVLLVHRRHKETSLTQNLQEEYAREIKKQFSSYKTSFVEVIKWTGEAAELRNKGFYVDFNGERWLHPRAVTKKQFYYGYSLAKMLVRIMSPTIRQAHKFKFQADDELRSLFNRSSQTTDLNGEQLLSHLTKTALGG
jgi:AbiV family abortive infection protein